MIMMDDLKQQLKSMWMAGDYGRVAKQIEGFAQELAERLDAGVGQRVLDVACGSGNFALAAARNGADVTGVDIATNLVAQARERAGAEGLTVRFDEGDVEQLPYDDSSFDLVSSTFGAMFAPRPDLAAAEMKRVCRPGGRIAMINWTPDSFAAAMFGATAKYSPPPPGVPSPLLWGDETTVRERFRDDIAELQLTRRRVPIAYPFPPAEVVEFFRTYFGPTKTAFDRLDADGQAAFRADLEAVWANANTADDGTTHVLGDVLEVVGRKC